MRYIVRADASIANGAGHVMRVSAIAEELINRNLDVIFVGDIKGLPWVQQRIVSLGFSEVHPDSSTFSANQESDVLILDSYVIDPGDAFVDQKKWKSVIAFVDNVTPLYKANLYIHSGSGTSWTPPLDCSEVPFLSGVNYLAIRKSIREMVRPPSFVSKPDLDITIVGGGSDPFGFCVAMSKFLHTLDDQFSVSIFTESTREVPIDSRFNYQLVGPKFDEHLKRTDLVFTTAGTSSWELLSLGLPIGLALAADNQRANYEFQVQNSLALDVGSYNSSGWWDLSDINIESLVNDATIRSVLCDNAGAAIDGQGVSRIANHILRILST